MQNRLTGRLYLLLLTFAAMLSLPSMALATEVAPDGTTSASTPTIQSDKEDYPPGATVTLTGGNWQPGESVHIFVNDDEGKTWSRDVGVTADDGGNIQDQFQLPDWFVATYKVTATGAQSGVATTSFTDGNVKVQANLSGSAQWTLTETLYSGSTCSGTPIAKNNNPNTVTLTGTASDTVGVGNTESLKLKATATSTDGKVFTNWTGPNSFSSTAQEICIEGFQSGSRDYTANYQANQAPVANNDTYSVNEDGTLNVPDGTNDVLSNDTDANNNTLTAAKVSDPAHGTLIFNSNGSFTYTPEANYNGTDSFTYKANDGFVDSNTATVNINVTAVDDNPVAVNDTKIVAEDDPATTIDVRANDTDIDGGPKTIASVTQPTNGTVAITNNGSDLTYKPNADYCNGGSPTDDFDYTLDAGSTAKVAVTVTCVNDAPKADAQSVTTDEDTAKAITLTGSDADGNNLTYSVVSGPTHGSLSGTSANLTYTPDANYNGADSFDFKVDDGNGGTDTATVSITVSPVNDAPKAAADSATTDEDVTLDSIDVLSNDSDVDGDSLSVSSVGAASHGTATKNADGTIKYVPNANYSGPDAFTYTVSDGNGGTDTATVSITVAPINDAPVAVDDDNYSVDEDGTLAKLAAEGVLSNDSDVDGDTLKAVLVSGPSHGTLNLNADGSFTYTPNNNYNGPDSFTYKANDGTTDSKVATVGITVNAVNDAPVADDQSVTTDEDTAKDVTLGASDVDGDALTYTIVDGPTHGSLSGTDANLTYTPNENYHGSDSFTFKANDGTTDSKVATVGITVNAVNDAPVAANDSATTDEDTATNINVIANDTDVDNTNAQLSVSSFTQPANGTVSENADGTLKYTPNDDHNGADSFTYKAKDTAGLDSNSATVSLTVNAVNDAPVAKADTKTTDEDAPLTFPSSDLVGNDDEGAANESGQTLTVTGVFDGTHGTVSLGTDGNITFTPEANFSGQATFDYRVCDNGSPSKCSVETATVNVTVNAVNDAPVAANDSATTDEDTATNINVIANDTDVDNTNAQLSVSSFTQPANGTVSENADGTLKYTPNDDHNGADSFTYTVSDGNGGTDQGTVSITVSPVNDAPSFTAGANETVAEDSGPQTVPGWASGISAGPADESGQAVDFLVSNDNDTLFSVQPAVSPNGALTYTPAANASGTATVTVRAHDSGGTANGGVDTSASQTFTITVNAVNDNPVIVSVTNNGPVAEASPATIKVTANDVDGDTLSYAFDCDNNSTFEVGPQATNSAECTFNDEGTYRVNVKVTDGNGGSATDFTSVVVNNAIPVIGPLTVTGNSGTACLGSTNVVRVSFSITDPGTSDTHSGTINWGDGTTTTFTGSSVTQQHSYSAGTYNITVNASDNDGGNAAPKSTTAAQQVSLRYNVSELQDPVNRPGMTMSVFKYGSTIPLKVLITDCNNQPVNGLVPKISFTKVNPSTPAIGVNEALSTQPNDTDFLMRDAGNGQYIYNLNTKTLADGDATYNATITDSKATQTAPATYGPKVTQNFGLRSK